MVQEIKNLNPIYLVPELLEEIFLGLPLKSIIKFKTVSKQWRSLMESKMFVERRMSLQKSHQKILAAYNCECSDRPSLLPESRFQGDEEIVYLHCNATRPLMTCHGLVCFAEQDCVNVLNPSTGQLVQFPYGPDPMQFRNGPGSVNWIMGFGRDKVTMSYKVVRMCFDECFERRILDVETGEWRKLRPTPSMVYEAIKSVCVNGSIYWLHVGRWWGYNILALDLRKEEFRNVLVPNTMKVGVTRETQMVNLDDRLAIAVTINVDHERILKIWILDTKGNIWSKSYSINLTDGVVYWGWRKRWFTPVSVSKQGNIVFHDNKKRLYKYYPMTDEIRCLSSDTCVISPYLENLVPLPLRSNNSDFERRTSKCHRLFWTHLESGSWISKVLKRNEFGILDVMCIVVVGYIWLRR